MAFAASGKRKANFFIVSEEDFLTEVQVESPCYQDSANATVRGHFSGLEMPPENDRAGSGLLPILHGVLHLPGRRGSEEVSR